MSNILILIIGVLVLGLVAALTEIRHSHKRRAAEAKGESLPEEPVRVVPPGCCAMHITCEKDSLLTAVSKSIVYYDDEELDRYAGVLPEEYNTEAVEEFEEILSTLQEEEVPSWIRSLQMRQIQMPISIKEQALFIVSEHRIQHRHDD
ncbi:phospholipase [Porphyromonas gingivalis]|uniref:phospholipase n=1 Tax=Porphyromonas gingivalis TaxID=837 RepID=UPI000BE73396|nr:phospholipase [Porphyromonas gingivalis]PDP73218.1 phospholipase [Porphyromonas gingivalis]